MLVIWGNLQVLKGSLKEKLWTGHIWKIVRHFIWAIPTGETEFSIELWDQFQTQQTQLGIDS